MQKLVGNIQFLAEALQLIIWKLDPSFQLYGGWQETNQFAPSVQFDGGVELLKYLMLITDKFVVGSPQLRAKRNNESATLSKLV